ncbi:MAG: 30S ribosome-binding factor RbfA [Firmicutes bacterium]|nr:30S ribosome-binding factor RbfA [Bacillota bacterium]
MTIKNERINSNLQKEISYIIANEVKNPNIKFVTITACDVTSDLSYAKVYFTTLGNINETLKGLKSAKGYIRRTLADRIELRHIPELEFIYDESIEYGKKIEEKIKEINEN